MDINEECKQIWNELGTWWDESVEDGDPFHKAFIYPSVEKFLELQGGETILDAGCGNGALSRYLAKRGGKVLGIDFSVSLLESAKKRSEGIEYQIMDLTDRDDLKKLANSRQFDRIVCSMVLHDMPQIKPFFNALKFLLKKEGFFIFSIPHPCFNSSSIVFEEDGAITIRNYYHLETLRLKSKPGQPLDQFVFHRPIEEYFRLLIQENMVLDGFEEPCVDPKLLPEHNLWRARPNIPPALISRWRWRQE